MSQARHSDENASYFPSKPSRPTKSVTRVPLKELPLTPKHTPIDLIDQGHYNDPIYLGCYAQNIFSSALTIESLFLVSPDYMKRQIYLNPKMRSILIDWLVSVHSKFSLSHETLYLTVNLIDRYLSRHSSATNELQLLGVTALLIACKYEEILVPVVSDLVFITDRAYTKEEIIETERKILKDLEYNVTICSEYFFFKRFATLESLTPDKEALGLYLLELGLLDYNMLKHKNSLKAASAVNVVKRITKSGTWHLQKHSGYSEDDLRACNKDLVRLWQLAPKSTLKGVREKFSKPEFFKVSQNTYNL